MKKLLFSLGTALAAATSFATAGWISNSGDIAENTGSGKMIDPAFGAQYFISQGGEKIWTLSADVQLTHPYLYVQNYPTGDYKSATTTFDFSDGNHTLTLSNVGWFQSNGVGLDSDKYTYFNYKGGTWDFNNHNVYFGYSVRTYNHMVTTLDGVCFTNLYHNYTSIFLTSRAANSSTTIKNGSSVIASKGDIVCAEPKTTDETNITVTVEGGSRVSNAGSGSSIHVDRNWQSVSGGTDWNYNLIVRGEGTVLESGANIFVAENFPGVHVLVDDHATVATAAGGAIYFGRNLAANNGSFEIDNGATVNCNNFRMGDDTYLVTNTTLRIGNDATLNLTGQFYSEGEYNNLIISNGTLQSTYAYAFYSGRKDSAYHGYKYIFQGSHPKLRCTAGGAAIEGGDAVFELVPGDLYTEPVIETKDANWFSSGTVTFKNVRECQKLLTEAVDVPIMKSEGSYASTGSSTVSELPAGCSFYRTEDNTTFYLHLEPAEPDVVKIGDVSYNSVDEAAQAAKAGDTITALGDFTLSPNGCFRNFSGTFDLDGYTATVEAAMDHYTFTRYGQADFTVENGTMEVNCAFMMGWPDSAQYGTTVTIGDGTTFNCYSHAYIGHEYGSQTLKIADGASYNGLGQWSCLYVGYGANDNTLIVEGALNLHKLILGGGTNGGGDSNQKVIFRGEGASFTNRDKPWRPMLDNFGCKNGEIVFDGATIDLASATNSIWYCCTNELYTGTQMSIINGAEFKVHDFFHGFFGWDGVAAIAARNQKVYIGADSKLTVSDQYRMVGFDNELVISNGTIDVIGQYSFYYGYDREGYTPFTSTGNHLVFQGTHPKLYSSGHPDEAQFAMYGTEVTFDVSEGAYEEAPIQGKSLEIHPDNGGSVKIVGADLLQAALPADSEGYDIPLMLSCAKNYCSCPQEIRDATNATLPDGCYLFKNDDSSALYLHIGPVPPAVAKIGDTEYSSLAKAFAAVENGETITLTDNIALDVAVTSTVSNVTLDLAGFTLEQTVEDYALIVNGGSLSIADTSDNMEGTITKSAKGTLIKVIGQGILKMTSGNLVLTGEAEGDYYGAIVKVEDGSFLMTEGVMDAQSEEHTYGVRLCKGSVSIEGGTFENYSTFSNEVAGAVFIPGFINVVGDEGEMNPAQFAFDATAFCEVGFMTVKDEGADYYTVIDYEYTPGLTYETAFTSVDEYNEYVTGEETAATYKDQDVYLVIRNFNFEEGIDYSLAAQDTLKLHAFFYNCTFPSANGTMNPSGPSEDVTASNRKMIAVVAAKEIWVEGCTFNAYDGDSYVIDINTSNTFDPEGCGVTIKGNTFLPGAGKRVPLSMKNKTATPLAFCRIVGNKFGACTKDIADTKTIVEDSTYAGVICFGDQSTSTTTDGGANFPITIEDNTFDAGVKQYVVMSGAYVSSGKEGIVVPVDQPFTWKKESAAWVATPSFHILEATEDGYTFDHEPTALEAGQVQVYMTAEQLALEGNAKAAYQALYARTVDGNSVTFELLPEAKEAMEDAAEEASPTVLALEGAKGSVKMTTTPGLYYTVATGSDPQSLSGTPVMATSTETSLEVPALPAKAGFYQVLVGTSK